MPVHLLEGEPRLRRTRLHERGTAPTASASPRYRTTLRCLHGPELA